MKYSVNSTKSYHVSQLNSLGWELTVCNALYVENSPLRKLLRSNTSYGHHLYGYLSSLLPMERIQKVIEIGGGYGYLMKGFLERNQLLRPCMLDISPYLSERQRETLKDYRVDYRVEDFLETAPDFLKGFDLAIMNENLGDFPALINLSRKMLELPLKSHDPLLRQALYFFERYKLDWPSGVTFNLNSGALEAVEKLCASGVTYIFLGEHSCEAIVPEGLLYPVHIESEGNPERISLMGHDEYSIKISYLQQVAYAHGYRCIRGPFADLIPFNVTDELRFIMASQGQEKDEDEMICHFLEDLYKYEYLLLIKETQ